MGEWVDQRREEEALVPVVVARPATGARGSLVAKRALDVVLSVCVMVMAAPIAIAVAAAIVLDTRGPVFYRAERVGHRREDDRDVLRRGNDGLRGRRGDRHDDGGALADELAGDLRGRRGVALR